MKEILILITLFIGVNIYSQDKGIKLVFEKEKKAIKQVSRYSPRQINGELFFNTYKLTGDGYEVAIGIDDIDIKLKRAFGLEYCRLIKKRHYKYIVNPECIYFGQDCEKLVYEKSFLKRKLKIN